MAQQSIKIKPIVGKHSYTLESTDTGYGVTKHNLCLERLNGNNTELYLPSDIPLIVNAVPFNEAEPSGKLKINSQQTADGFLFVANGPENNNFHLHLKKSAPDNSRYSIEINLTQGKKYTFSIAFVSGQYLLVQGESSNYYEMVDAINSNNYFKEALSHLDDEFSKYSGNDQLEWWAQAVVGLFQDLVDVEAISLISSAQTASYYTAFFEGVSNEYYSFLPIYWFSGGQEYIQILFPGQFMVLRVSEGTTVGLYSIAGSYLDCKLNKCVNFSSSEEQDICIMECMNSGDDGGGNGGGGTNSDSCAECIQKCQDKYNEDRKNCSLIGDGLARQACEQEAKRNFDSCVTLCYIDYNGVGCPQILPYDDPSLEVSEPI